MSSPKDTLDLEATTPQKRPKESLNWTEIFRREEGEIEVIKIVEEIVKQAGDVVYEHYIQRRVVPFAVVQAQQEILKITEVF
jgi:hypothetical protein